MLTESNFSVGIYTKITTLEKMMARKVNPYQCIILKNMSRAINKIVLGLILHILNKVFFSNKK